jgi:hypothetical protein
MWALKDHYGPAENHLAAQIAGIVKTKWLSRNEQRGREEPHKLPSWDHHRYARRPALRYGTAEDTTEPIGLLSHL